MCAYIEIKLNFQFVYAISASNTVEDVGNIKITHRMVILQREMTSSEWNIVLFLFFISAFPKIVGFSLHATVACIVGLVWS